MPQLPSTEEEIQEEPQPIPRVQTLAPRREEEEEEPQTPMDYLRRGLAGIRRSLGGREEAPRDLGRRAEITPNRRVQFSTHLTPREREWQETQAPDEELGEIEGMSLLSLQRALRAERLKTEQAERALREERRRSAASSEPRDSLGSAGEMRRGSYRNNIAKPKLKEPPTFKGEYKETYNAHNWLHQLYRYLTQCNVDEAEFSGYARTYMGENEQAWMDAEFGDQDIPPWKDFSEALIERYVPPDHDDRLERMFKRMKQRDTLLHYIEQWQVLDSALTFSKIHISNRRKVSGFIEGMKDREDKYKVIHVKPATLKEVYSLVHDIRRAKILLDSGEHFERTKEKRKGTRETSSSKRSRRLNKLEGAAKKRAWDEGACLNCGAKDHFIAQCPKLKTTIKSTIKKYAKLFTKNEKYKSHKKTYSDRATAGSKKRLHQLKTQSEDPDEAEDSDSVEEDEESSNSSGTASEEEGSHTEESMTEGEEENSHPGS